MYHAGIAIYKIQLWKMFHPLFAAFLDWLIRLAKNFQSLSRLFISYLAEWFVGSDRCRAPALIKLFNLQHREMKNGRQPCVVVVLALALAVCL